MLLCQILVPTIHGKKIKRSYSNNNLKIYAPTWHNKFELPDRSYSVYDIQDFLRTLLKSMKQ